MTDRHSDRPIAVGDLVQVVRTVCCDATLGSVFRVGFFVDGAGYQCYCGARCPHEPLAIEAWGKEAGSGPVSCLKRIPPLDELESSKTDEPMKEPA